MNLLDVQSISKTYGKGEACVHALKKATFSVPKGEFVAIVGESGSGKSTLLNMVGALDTPTEGKVFIDGKDIFAMDEEYRGLIGYMPQNYSVYPGFTARDFLEYMGVLKGIPKDRLESRISEVLEFVNLSDVAGKKVKTFSGGMKRRIGIAQAIINEP